MNVMNNDNNNGNNGSTHPVRGVVIDLVGGRTLSVCPICRNGLLSGPSPPMPRLLRWNPTGVADTIFTKVALRDGSRISKAIVSRVPSAVVYARESSTLLIENEYKNS
jgi:hypothetical protein